MQKKLHSIRAVIIIIILSLFIILPPLSRLLFPKVEEAKSKNNDKITLLTCTRNYAEENIKETVEVRYINAKINQTKIVYTAMSEKEYLAMNITENDFLPSTELFYFQSIEGISIDQSAEKTTVLITQDTIDKNPNNQEFKENYFNDKKIDQKIYFTNRYYECEETTI